MMGGTAGQVMAGTNPAFFMTGSQWIMCKINTSESNGLMITFRITAVNSGIETLELPCFITRLVVLFDFNCVDVLL